MRAASLLTPLFLAAGLPLSAAADQTRTAPDTPTAPTAVVVETLGTELEGGTGGISVAPDGRIFVADFGELLDGSGATGTRVWAVTPSGESSVFADGFVGASGNELGPDGTLYQSNIGGNFISRVHADGTNERWVSEGFEAPVGITQDAQGDLIVANCGSGSLQRVTLDGVSTRFVTDSLLQCPNGITTDDDGILYVANFRNGDVVRVTPDGAVSRLATIPGGNNGHLLHHEGVLYVVARGAHRIYTVTLDGTVELLAGSGEQGLDDGPALQATFSYPNDIGMSPDGRYLYVNDVADLSSEGRLLAPMVVRRIRLDREPGVR